MSISASSILCLAIIVPNVISFSVQNTSEVICNIYVLPQFQPVQNICCCLGKTAPCNNLNSALDCTRHGHTQNVIIHLPENNSLILKAERNNILVGVENFQIVGASMQPSHINCESGAGLVFVNSKNVSIMFSHFHKCNFSNSIPPMLGSLNFINTSNIQLVSNTLANAESTGLIIYNCSGLINIYDLWITNNNAYRVNGGGAFIDFPHNNLPDLIKVNISSSLFFHNKIHCLDRKTTCRGGGLYVNINTSNVLLYINASFVNNTAYWGSGIFLHFLTSANNNSVTINHTYFMYQQYKQDNYLQTNGGGAMILFGEKSSGNVVKITSCRFFNNIASYGGGLSIGTEAVLLQSEVIIFNSTFSSNTGQIGSAIYVSSMIESTCIQKSETSSVVIKNCTFQQNFVPYNRPKKALVIDWGTVYTSRLPLRFFGINFFDNNTGTGLVVSDTSVQFTLDSAVTFVNNTGHSGGAIASLNSGSIIISQGVELIFVNNSADNKGGAIYVSSYGHCFVNIKKNTQYYAVRFYSNTARGEKNSLYVDSISQCTDSMSNSMNSVFCSQYWDYYDSNNCTAEILTGPVYFELENSHSTSSSQFHLSVFSGMKKLLPLVIYDAFHNDITAVTSIIASIKIKHQSAILDPSSHYISDNAITIYKVTTESSSVGDPILHLQTEEPNVIYTSMNIYFLPCPPGYEETENSLPVKKGKAVECQCSEGNYGGTVHCDSNSVGIHAILDSSAIMAYDWDNHKYYIAPSLFISNVHLNSIPLPTNVSLLNDLQCGPFKRTGYFCGDCIHNNEIDITSNNYKCMECTSNYGWIEYLFINFLFLTIFFLIILIFSVNITNGSLGTYILYCQALSLPDTIIHIERTYSESLMIKTKLIDVLILPMSIWNLNFQALVPKSICIHNIRIIHAFILEFLAATYPIVFLAICYILIEMHARNNTLIKLLWKPFRRCFSKVRNTWNNKRSVIDAFAAFLLISYTKFACISLYLLIPQSVRDSNGHTIRQSLLIDPSITFLSKEHQPFFFIALIVFFFVILPTPLLLFLYTFSWFQNMLHRMNIRHHCIVTFMEAFQGFFKDGTDGTKDCRSFAALYFMLRFCMAGFAFFSGNLILKRYMQFMMALILLILLSVVAPYKKNIHNKLDMILVATLLCNIFIAAYFNFPEVYRSLPQIVIAGLIIYAPIICVTLYTVHLVIKYFIRCCFTMRSQGERELLLGHNSLEAYPHRMVEPNRYEDMESSVRDYSLI